jgi:hypothetical protein
MSVLQSGQTDSASAHAPPVAKVDSLLNECQSLMSALGTARWTRRLLLLGLLAFAGGSVYFFYGLLSKLTSKESIDTIAQTVQNRLAGQTDTYMRQFQLLVDKSSPVVTDAFYTRAKSDLPLLLQGVEKERDKFVDNLKGRVEKLLAEHYDAMITKNEQLLIKELPEVEDPEVRKRLVANLHLALEKMIRKYYADELNNRLVAMYDRWDHFPAVDRVAGDSTRLEDQFIATLLELLSKRLTETTEKTR